MEATAPPIAAASSVGAVHLTVAELDRSLEFYERALGLRTLERDGTRASLGAGGVPLLVLDEEPGARPADGYTGLFHFALLVPGRVDLARWLAHAVREGVPLTGASDHFVSEAVYLRDPDRHGIEVYRDRPREHWEGQVGRMGTWPLDADDLLRELEDPRTEPFDGLAAGTTMGHVHLRAAEIPGTVAFYRDVLGFELMAEYGAQAAFLAAGGYHHHVGANVWESRGAPPAPPGTARLLHATVVLPDADERDRVAARVAETGQEPEEHEEGLLVRDPSQNAILLAAA
jgi:catechol 2,3-dioxygenase